MDIVYKLVTGPDYTNNLPLSLANAKAQLNIDSLFIADDNFIKSCIKDAADFIEGQIQGPLITQTWEAQLWDFGECIKLWKSPVSSVTSIKYYDSSNSDTLINSSYYQMDLASMPARIFFESNFNEPTVYDRFDAVRVLFVAGYANEASIPNDLMRVLKLKVTEFYEIRTSKIIGSISSKLDLGIDDTLFKYRAWL